MSYLQRTGNNRNDISYTTTVSNSIKYLNRTANGRNDVKFATVPNAAKILERTGNGRNNVQWSNVTVIPAEGQLFIDMVNEILMPENGSLHVYLGDTRELNESSSGVTRYVWDEDYIARASTIINNTSGGYYYFSAVGSSGPDSINGIELTWPRNGMTDEKMDQINAMFDTWREKYDEKKMLTKIWTSTLQHRWYDDAGKDELYDYSDWKYLTNLTCNLQISNIRYNRKYNEWRGGEIKIYFTYPSEGSTRINTAYILAQSRLYYR